MSLIDMRSHQCIALDTLVFGPTSLARFDRFGRTSFGRDSFRRAINRPRLGSLSYHLPGLRERLDQRLYSWIVLGFQLDFDIVSLPASKGRLLLLCQFSWVYDWLQLARFRLKHFLFVSIEGELLSMILTHWSRNGVVSWQLIFLIYHLLAFLCSSKWTFQQHHVRRGVKEYVWRIDIALRYSQPTLANMCAYTYS